MEIRKVGILGAGTMGGGIAHVVAQAGFQVVILDISDRLVNEAISRIEKSLSKNVEKGKIPFQEKDQILKRIKPTIQIEDLRDAELIIEAVVEDLKLKLDLFRRLNDLCLRETIFASNTSTLSITGMAAAISPPERFLGIHFFNPVPYMRLVEVIRGLQTSEGTVRIGINFVEAINKIPIQVQDCPGFLVNRIFMPYCGEAMLAAQEGARSPLEIDETVKGFGFPMGPLTLNDMVGIDVGVRTFSILHEAYGERFPAPLLFEKLFKAGRLGIKSGKGIYRDGKLDDEFFEIIKAVQMETGIKGSDFSVERLILRQVNEAIFCLQEKIATAEDIDRAMVLGTGFPSDEEGVGGPLHWADDQGLDSVLEKLIYFRNTLGTRFLPHFLLKQYVAAEYLGKKVRKGFFEY